MRPEPTREQRLRTLREQERAAALERLGRAEAARRGIEAELGLLDQRLHDLAESAQPIPLGTAAPAGVLEVGSRRHERDRRQGERLRAERLEVVARLRAARAAVETAQQEVASAALSLRALGL